MADEIPAARKAVEALSRRGMRLGTGPIELRELREQDGQVEVEVRGAPPRLGGYRVAAALYHEGGETTVEPVPGEEALEESRWRRAAPWCEHCAVRRYRRVTYLLRGDRGLVQVGSTCLADFTGARDPARAARQAQLLAEARRATVGCKVVVDDVPGDLAPLDEFMGWVCELAAEEGFRSRRRARDEDLEATGDGAWERVQGGEAAAAARSTAAAVIRWVRASLAEVADRSEYEDRLVWALSRPRLRRSERYLVASALGSYMRAEQPYIGEAGKRVDLEVWVELASHRAREGRFGETYFHRLRDGFGRLVVWYATGKRLERGARYELRGTVRRHGSFGDELATAIHRCRVMSSEHEPHAADNQPSVSTESACSKAPIPLNRAEARGAKRTFRERFHARSNPPAEGRRTRGSGPRGSSERSDRQRRRLPAVDFTADSAGDDLAGRSARALTLLDEDRP